ncbi:response regulator transcription factor [Membranihabitans maritimus]|uniref:response regulator transcription factor n=1 Tax=Membranihabitans maritimus TaxID=2904244 RepID=UPI001F18CAE4|nr:response regulator transcription factor [Membranihabitans maritimus]
MKTQILVIDDHSIVRLGIKYLSWKTLNAETYEAENLSEARKILQTRPIDLIILDIGLPDWEGVKVIKDLKKIKPRARVLVCSAHSETVYSLRCIDAGADGYMQKSVNQEDTCKAILSVLNGRQYISEKMRDHIMESRLSQGNIYAEKNPLSLLTDREMEVCELLRKGLRISEIADQMKLHTSTVSTYKTKIFEKLKVTNVNLLVDKLRLYDYFV